MEKKLVLSLDHWETNCGDGCCYDWGVDLEVNGVVVSDNIEFSDSFATVLMDILENVMPPEVKVLPINHYLNFDNEMDYHHFVERNFSYEVVGEVLLVSCSKAIEFYYAFINFVDVPDICFYEGELIVINDYCVLSTSKGFNEHSIEEKLDELSRILTLLGFEVEVD